MSDPAEVLYENELSEIENFSQKNKSSEKRRKVRMFFRKRNLPTLLRLTRRTSVFLFLTLVMLLVFYVTGSFQNFLESNMKTILFMISVAGIALAFVSFAAFLECIYFVFYTKRVKIGIYSVIFLLVSLFGAACAVMSMIINLLSEGF